MICIQLCIVIIKIWSVYAILCFVIVSSQSLSNWCSVWKVRHYFTNLKCLQNLSIIMKLSSICKKMYKAFAQMGVYNETDFNLEWPLLDTRSIPTQNFSQNTCRIEQVLLYINFVSRAKNEIAMSACNLLCRTRTFLYIYWVCAKDVI